MTAADKSAREAQQGLAARKAAALVLDAVLIKHQALDQVLGKSLSTGWMANLPARDRALTRAIIGQSLRRKGQIDKLLESFLEKGLPQKSGLLYPILLSGAAQLLFLSIPPHAALDLAVRLAQSDGRTRRFDKLVNAVLRRVTREGEALIAGQDAPRLNTPDWLWDRWCGTYGEERAREMAEIHLTEAPLDLTVKAGPDSWARELGGRELPGGTVRLIPKGRIEQIEGYDDGAWWVQDFAASLPARLLGDLEGKRVLDLCAAPGGKTAQLVLAGGDVLALDISEARLKTLKQNLARLGLPATCGLGDAATWVSEERFDAILLDAPCSSTGTIRRHPDIPYLKTAADIEVMATLQSRLLDNAVRLLKPGGTLVYATCSLEPEEGEAQIAALLARNSAVSLVPIAPSEVFGHDDWLTAAGTLRTLPSSFQMEGEGWSGMDGFFAARLRQSA
ncbi:transcription antitermination factor NusB [Methyloligella sp. 2.7D]|uniref:RsmB/NOP family class I SAM-dependent RNA methyltransferase n=1 Tax=unclassified Methyloligella TaxID=2625955 RepID=UPI00157D8A61|nr:transcription antitermination factor NusB [Methyloligella sp. GL2]QKP76194.1 methyltransferase domain-containing protein [Methyloligella sp. GL2]